MEEGGPSFGKVFFRNMPARDSFFFLKSEKGHIGVIPHHHTIMETKGEVRRIWGRSMEVNGGDLGGGESEGELAPFVFLFSPATCLFWVFPSELPNKGKNAQIKKRDQR